ncbi:hypothetical protein [Rhizobium sp. RU36D]|uniref:hypothetical protein n=1 Tax=Rhizobium sp. RU36D TaxID=1907415 RepID=UPI0009D89FB8|nr:hypothetical protein [Rhizobium sp. RU36D]SMD02422.1 hypothetical protein SAMN05880593_1162 [Rhizobium sp. RU36D]
MLKVSALLSLIMRHHQFFAENNQPMPADTVATVARLLSCCREEAVDMEARLYPAEPAAEAPAEQVAPALTNVIHLNFPSAGSPAAPDIA